MKNACLVFTLLLLPALLPAQDAIPAGTVLPLQLETGLNAGRVKAGQAIRAKVMQDVPGTRIRRGAKVLGHVISVSPTRLELRFDTISMGKKTVPVRSNLRALASMMAVEEAQLPEGGPDRALPPEDWTTTQVGGEQVYRGGGPVADGLLTVGKPVAYGVVGQVRSNPPCRAAIADNSRPQALWIFSTNACGVFGFSDLAIEHFGRTAPQGMIALVSKSGKLNIRSGSGLLLRVQGS